MSKYHNLKIVCNITILLFFAGFVFSYSQTITGVVSDVQNKPLENANIIAKPLQEKALLKFAIADNKGRYKLQLEKNIDYEITVSYIGFVEEVFDFKSNSLTNIHDFKLLATGENLKEIIIKHDYKPIIIKKDTLIYDIKSFAKGNERKLKEILEKLPGVEVDKKGNVTVQGKKVTKMLVEGKFFFGGGSKLAVENIPADALDKIEVIDHFTEVGFMKQVSDSDELAMNVKLKGEKKKFVFGDINSGAEVGKTDNGFYMAHTALFYYSLKSNISYIGDINSIGKSTFSFEDLMRFDGGASSFLSGRKSLSNLVSFADDSKDVVKNKSQFSALNFSIDISPKVAISGYGLFSKIVTESKINIQNSYFQNNTTIEESVFDDENDKSLLALANIKMDYNRSRKEKLYYNFQYQSSTNDLLKTLKSITYYNSSNFETISKSDANSFKQYLEYHKSINSKNIITFVVNQALETDVPKNRWLTNQKFLSGLLPLIDDNNFIIEQVKKTTNNSIDAIFKHYLVLNNWNHIYTNIGNNYSISDFETSEKQFLSNGLINDFSLSGFGNKLKYQLNDSYIGFEYKFRIGKWTNKPGVYLHNFNLTTNQKSEKNNISKSLLQPQFDSDYEFNKSENLYFNYKFVTVFPDSERFANRFTLQYYNTIYKGNALLTNERFHTSSLRYSKINMYRGIVWNVNANFNKKVKTIRDKIEIDGINQFNTPFITNNPETNIRFNSYISKRVYKFNLLLKTNLSFDSYTQSLNNITRKNDRNNQNIGFSIKSAYKKWPDISIGYEKAFGQFDGVSKSNFKSEIFKSDLDIILFDNLILKTDYEFVKNTSSSRYVFFDIANTTLFYQKKHNPLSFEFSVNNIFNIKSKNDNSFSDFSLSNQTTFILPRIVMLTIGYKL